MLLLSESLCRFWRAVSGERAEREVKLFRSRARVVRDWGGRCRLNLDKLFSEADRLIKEVNGVVRVAIYGRLDHQLYCE